MFRGNWTCTKNGTLGGVVLWYKIESEGVIYEESVFEKVFEVERGSSCH